MKNYSKHYGILMMSILLTSCLGGSSGSKTTGNNVSGNAQFIDAPVKGLTLLNLDTNSLHVTNEEGKFTCSPGQTISFKIGGLELGRAACNEKIFITDFGDGRWQKAAKILQSISQTDPSDGLIDVTSFSGNLASIDLDNDNESSINSVLGSDAQRTVTIAEAESHAISNLLSRSNYSSEFESLFTGNTKSYVVTAERTSGGSECQKYYNIKISFNKKSASSIYYTASLDSIVGYSSNLPLAGEDCNTIGDPSCEAWGVLVEQATLVGDSFKLAKYSAAGDAGNDMDSGYNKVSANGKIVANGDGTVTLTGNWNEVYEGTEDGELISGSCAYSYNTTL